MFPDKPKVTVSHRQGFTEDIVEKVPFYYWEDYIQKFGHPKNNKKLGHKVCKHPMKKRKGVILPRDGGPVELERRWFDTNEKTEVLLDGADSCASVSDNDGEQMMQRIIDERENQYSKVAKGTCGDELARMVASGQVAEPTCDELNELFKQCKKQKEEEERCSQGLGQVGYGFNRFGARWRPFWEEPQGQSQS